MKGENISRRSFLRNTSLTAAGAIAGTFSKTYAETGEKEKSSKPPKILNYHPKMGYRRLGKTRLMLSEISLGGHWKNRNGGRYWDTFANDQTPADVAKNRTEVISACIDSGINYLDITTAAECLAYGAALKGRREKMYVGADDHRLGPRNPDNRNVKALTRDIDQCLRRLQTDYLDIWRVQAMMDGSNSDEDVEIMIQTFEKAHKAGKVRHFGISTHSRPWTHHVIEKFDEVEMFVFPCSAKTKEKGQLPTEENVVEVNPGHGADQTQSVFQSLRSNNVGLVTIKPFFGGNLFKSYGQDKFPVMGVGSKKENDLARLTLQCILTKDAITAAVPGMSTVYEVDNAARASYTRKFGQTAADKQWLEKITDQQWAKLPQEYAWLRDWEVI